MISEGDCWHSLLYQDISWLDIFKKSLQWLPGTGEKGGMLLLNGYRVSVWDDANVVEMDGCNGCTTLWMCLMPLILCLKMVKMVSFMLCIFYHNTKKKPLQFSHFWALIFFSFHSDSISCMPLIPGATPLLSCNLRMETAIAHLAMFQGRLSHCVPLLLQRAKLQPNLPLPDRKPGPPLLSHLRNNKPREKAESRRGTKILSFALLLLVFHFLLHLQSF